MFTRGPRHDLPARGTKTAPPCRASHDQWRTVVRASLLVFTLLLSLAPAQACAATGHEFLSSLSEAAGKPLEEPSAVAIDQESARVFVADAASGVIDVYSSTGAYITQVGEAGTVVAAGLAVDEATGELYVANSFQDSVQVYDPDGQDAYQLLSEWTGDALPGEEFGEVAGIVVNNDATSAAAGEVYVLDASDPVGEGAVIDVIKPRPAGTEEAQEGELQRRITAKVEGASALALDSSQGQILLGDSEQGTVYEYGEEGALEEKFKGKTNPYGGFSRKEEEGESIAALGFEETSGDFYVAEAQHDALSQYSSTGQWLGWITTTPKAPLARPKRRGRRRRRRRLPRRPGRAPSSTASAPPSPSPTRSPPK